MIEKIRDEIIIEEKGITIWYYPPKHGDEYIVIFAKSGGAIQIEWNKAVAMAKGILNYQSIRRRNE
jgi:hypothetical protein